MGLKVILIGFMGAGKSTIGPILANKLDTQFYETDEVVLSRSGRASINEIFQMDGESQFRKLERLVASEFSNLETGVVSTGGGMGADPDTISILKGGDGKVVYLEATFEEIRNRLSGDTTRPLFHDLTEAKQLYTIRSTQYLKSCDLTVHTDTIPPELLADRILARLYGPVWHT